MATTSISFHDFVRTGLVADELQLRLRLFEVAINEKPTGRFMIRQRTRVVKRHPEGDW